MTGTERTTRRRRGSHHTWGWWNARWWAGCVVFCSCLTLLAQAPPLPPRENPAGEPVPPSLIESQEEIQLRFRRFETSLLNMAQYLRQNEPERAALLERVMGKSNEGRFSQQMEKVIEVLKKDQLGEALEREESLVEGLQALLDLLNSEDRAKELAEEKARIEAYLKDVQKLLGDQRDVRAGTERGENSQQLAPRQDRLAKRTQELEQRIARDSDARKKKQQGARPDSAEKKEAPDKKNGAPDSKDSKSDPEAAPMPKDQQPSEGQQGESKPNDPKPSESKPREQGKPQSGKPEQGQPNPSQQAPPEKGRQELERARQEMQRALENLKKQQGKEASERQDAAIQELERAKQQLEKILKQMREEEKDRYLARLEERLQQMLIAQTGIYGDTLKIHKVPEKERTGLHRNNAVRLGRQEKEQVIESEKILRLFSEEGSAVAFNEAVLLMRNDQQTVAGRLDQAEVGDLTQSIEKDILATLKEMIGALQKEMENRRQQKAQQQSQQQPQNSAEQDALVEKIAELKMLQRLQVRVNNRTRELEKLTSGDKPPDQAILEQLRKLAQGQARIQQAAYDLAIGRNEQ